MAHMRPQVIAHSITAVLAFVLLALNFVLVYGVDVFGSPFLFAGSLVAEVFLLVVFLYSVTRALKVPLDILGTIFASAWDGILSNRYIQRLRKTKSWSLRWLGARLNPHEPTGTLLSAGALLTLIFLSNFISVLDAVLTKSSLTQTDTRVANLMPMVRTTLQTDFFRVVTFTASPISVVMLVVCLISVLWFSRQRAASVLVFVTVFVEEICVFAIKHLVNRSRPPLSLSLIHVSGSSFPSGHTLTATVVFGLLTYLIYRAYTSSLLRLCTALAYVISVGLVALSRVYLGVHYPSDVLASIWLGLALLTVSITVVEVAVRAAWWHVRPADFENKKLVMIVPVILLFSLIASPFFERTSVPTPSAPHEALLSTINTQTATRLPSSSETLTGKNAEPVDFIYIGTQVQITQLFLSHGWYKAAPSTLTNTLQAFSVGFQGGQYLTAPVTPFYINTQPEVMAFEKSTQANTLRQRHHTRIWRSGYELPNGQDIWVATASFDEGIEFAGAAKLPTHHIAPDLDGERSYILRSLGIAYTEYIPVSQPEAGQNSSGDIFFTDGNAAIVRL